MNDFQKRIGVGEASNVFVNKSKKARRRRVVSEEGSNRGKVTGFHTDHPDGRVDATVFAPTTSTTAKSQEI